MCVCIHRSVVGEMDTAVDESLDLENIKGTPLGPVIH